MKQFVAIVSIHQLPVGPDGTHSNFREMISRVTQPIVEGFFPEADEIKAITMPDGALHVGYFRESS